MPSFTNDTSNQTCTLNLPQKMVKKMTVFGKTTSKPEMASSINNVVLPKSIPYPTGIMPIKFQNMVFS